MIEAIGAAIGAAASLISVVVLAALIWRRTARYRGPIKARRPSRLAENLRFGSSDNGGTVQRPIQELAARVNMLERYSAILERDMGRVRTDTRWFVSICIALTVGVLGLVLAVGVTILTP